MADCNNQNTRINNKLRNNLRANKHSSYGAVNNTYTIEQEHVRFFKDPNAGGVKGAYWDMNIRPHQKRFQDEVKPRKYAREQNNAALDKRNNEWQLIDYRYFDFVNLVPSFMDNRNVYLTRPSTSPMFTNPREPPKKSKYSKSLNL